MVCQGHFWHISGPFQSASRFPLSSVCDLAVQHSQRQEEASSPLPVGPVELVVKGLSLWVEMWKLLFEEEK